LLHVDQLCKRATFGINYQRPLNALVLLRLQIRIEILFIERRIYRDGLACGEVRNVALRIGIDSCLHQRAQNLSHFAVIVVIVTRLLAAHLHAEQVYCLHITNAT
jgi:hypothetical protein